MHSASPRRTTGDRNLARAALLGIGLALTLAAPQAIAAASSPAQDTKPGATPSMALGPTLTGAPTADLRSLFQQQGLLDPNRLTTWRSYSFGFGTGGGRTTSGGLLVQHMHYQISKPLSLYMELGLQHNPLGMAGLSNSGSQQASLTIPRMELIYRPTENVVFSVLYSRRSRSQWYPWSQSARDPWWTRAELQP